VRLPCGIRPHHAPLPRLHPAHLAGRGAAAAAAAPAGRWAAARRHHWPPEHRPCRNSAPAWPLPRNGINSHPRSRRHPCPQRLPCTPQPPTHPRPSAPAGLSRTGLAASAATGFVLPFKVALLADGGSRQLLQRFDDVQPTLLLFLKKLSCLAVTHAADPTRSRWVAGLGGGLGGWSGNRRLSRQAGWLAARRRPACSGAAPLPVHARWHVPQPAALLLRPGVPAPAGGAWCRRTCHRLACPARCNRAASWCGGRWAGRWWSCGTARPRGAAAPGCWCRRTSGPVSPGGAGARAASVLLRPGREL
jgi:hypothetical protein